MFRLGLEYHNSLCYCTTLAYMNALQQLQFPGWAAIELICKERSCWRCSMMQWASTHFACSQRCDRSSLLVDWAWFESNLERWEPQAIGVATKRYYGQNLTDWRDVLFRQSCREQLTQRSLFRSVKRLLSWAGPSCFGVWRWRCARAVTNMPVFFKPLSCAVDGHGARVNLNQAWKRYLFCSIFASVPCAVAIQPYQSIYTIAKKGHVIICYPQSIVQQSWRQLSIASQMIPTEICWQGTLLSKLWNSIIQRLRKNPTIAGLFVDCAFTGQEQL